MTSTELKEKIESARVKADIAAKEAKDRYEDAKGLAEEKLAMSGAKLKADANKHHEEFDHSKVQAALKAKEAREYLEDLRGLEAEHLAILQAEMIAKMDKADSE